MCPTEVISLDFLAAPETSLVILSLLPCFLLSLFLLAAPYLFFDFLKETRRPKQLPPSFIPTGPTPKETKALNSSLPLTPTGPAARKKVSINSSQAFVPTLKLE